MKRINRISYLVALLVLALMLASCVPENNPGGQVPATGETATNPASEGQVPAADATATEAATEAAAEEMTATAPAIEEATATAPAEGAAAGTPTAEGAAAVAEATDLFLPTVSNRPVPTDTVTTFPNPAGFVWQPVIDGLSKPLDLTAPPDGTDRIFIVEQTGAVRILQNGSLLPEPFLNYSDKVLTRGSEQGLLGFAFHPQYAENGFFYINYIDLDGNTVIARLSVSDDPNLADPNSEVQLLYVDQPYPNHNGGGMVFGPDGYLYMSLGDGGSGGDPQGNAQKVTTLLGKILRVDVDSGDPYGIPADNPFAGGENGARPENFLYGLRNPWRFSFDRLTGDLYIADVGQNAWEEIDFLAAGEPGGVNYGWDYREGAHPFEGTPPAGLELVDPVYEYQHGVGCSVTGGYVYRGEALPEFRGIYLFSDFCSGRVWGLLRGSNGAFQAQELFQTGWNVTSFGQDAQGEVYLMDQGSGTVYRLQRK